MPSRTVTVNGVAWRVYPSGFITQSDRDEFGLLFVRGEAAHREVRLTRYSPQGVQAREQSLGELSDDRLAVLFAESQPADTAPETGYQS